MLEASGPTGHSLTPYVPRLLVEWLHETPSARHRSIEGTLAFVDISGFTSMTERLARKGKVGAEEMSDTLNALFTDLLAVAYDDGAGLVKWGGDAVLLLFDGENHAERACRAAINMQRTIVRVGRIETSVGQVRLRMSVGIHSGRFDFFLVGDPAIHRELVIAGPASTETVLMEQTAEAGEIAVSAATAAFLDQGSIRGRKDEAFLLGAAPDVPFLSARPGPNVGDLDLAPLVPFAIREYLLSGDEHPEHRRITAAFLEFTGSDELLAREGPEALAEALDACVTTVQRAAFAHDVGFFETDVARNAWRIMLIVGAPRSSGGDEDRMLDTLRSVIETDLPLPLRIGTNGGHVFAGYFGPQFRKTYSVKGDAVNLAARVMAKAERGQILATASVLDAALGLYDTEAIAPFAAKGKRKPVEASAVGRRTGSRSETLDLPLVGRRAELASLRSAVADARHGRGSALEIVGTPGIGKTRLLQELVAVAAGFGIRRALCEAYHQQVPYRPFRAILRGALDIPRHASPAEGGEHLRSIVGAQAPELAPWLPLLAIVADVESPMTKEVSELGEDFRRRKLEEVTVALLRSVLSKPTVLAFEDVHWMDEASADLLTRLVEAVAATPWVVAVSRRDEATGFVLPERERCSSIGLRPLERDEAEEVVTSVTHAQPLRRHDVDALTARAAGNPLFLGQLLKIALQSGSADGLPLSIESLVTAEIDRLSAADRRVLRFASVLGVAFDDDLLAGLLEVDDEQLDPTSWDRLAGFVESDGPGHRRFRHALMREAAYEGLPFRRRRGLHARAGVLIIAGNDDPTEEAEVLALHFYEAQSYFDAWQYARVAGERALAKFANAEAASFFDRAIESGRRADVAPTKLANVYESLGNVKVVLNEFQAARAAYSAGRRLVADPATQAQFLLQEAKVHYRAGRFSDAIRSTRRAMRLVDGDERPKVRKLLVRLSAFYAGMRVVQGRYPEAEAWCLRVLEATKSVREREALARAYYMLDFIYMDQGRVEEAVYSKRAAELYARLGDLSNQAEVISNSGADAFELGDWDRALALHEQSLELRRRLGDDGEAAICAANIAEIYLEQGRLSEAAELLAGAARATRAGEYLPPHAYIVGLLGRVSAAEGRFDEALERFAESRAVFERVGYRAYVFLMQVRTAELFVQMGDPERALDQAEEALRIAVELGGTPSRLPLLHRVRAYAHIQLGSFGDARAALAESLATARARQRPHDVGLALEALGQLDRLEGRKPDLAGEEEARSILTRLAIISAPALPGIPVPAHA